MVSDNRQMYVYFSMTESQVMDFLTAYPSMEEAIHHFPKVRLLLPGGKPYDTLEEVIGIRPSNGSLAEYGISYRQVDLLPDGSFDCDRIEKALNEKTKMVTIQRSKGYATRPTLSVERIGELIGFIKERDRKSVV